MADLNEPRDTVEHIRNYNKQYQDTIKKSFFDTSVILTASIVILVYLFFSLVISIIPYLMSKSILNNNNRLNRLILKVVFGTAFVIGLVQTIFLIVNVPITIMSIEKCELFEGIFGNQTTFLKYYDIKDQKYKHFMDSCLFGSYRKLMKVDSKFAQFNKLFETLDSIKTYKKDKS